MTTTTFNVGIAYAEYKHRRAAFILAAIVAFTMSSYFVVGYLAGDLLFWVWDIAQGMNGAVGIGICAVMTAYQFILYSQGDMKGGRKATLLAVCVAVGFSLLSEVGQGMERDHVRMESKSQQSPTYQAIVGKITNTTGPVGTPLLHRPQTSRNEAGALPTESRRRTMERLHRKHCAPQQRARHDYRPLQPEPTAFHHAGEHRQADGKGRKQLPPAG